MTNPIGPGTVNLSLNMPTEARKVIGQLACRSGMSMGAFLRQLINRSLDGLNPEAAVSIREADFRRRVKRLKL